MKRLAEKLCLAAMFLCFTGAGSFAQDTLKLTLAQAENQFLQKNLSLLAEKYNIDIAKAQTIQARLYPNPNLAFVGSLYNTQSKKALDVSSRTGEYILNAQQLVLLAGKRNKQIKLAEANETLSENRFFDLLRTLKYTLHSDFFQLYYLQNSLSAYQTQIDYLQQLNTAYQELYAKGVVSLKDAVRIRSLLYSLVADQTSLKNQVNAVNAEMQLLLQNNAVYVEPMMDQSLQVDAAHYSLAALVDTAFANREDLKLAQNTVLYDQQNYSLQKAMAVPDLTLGAQFDKRGSFVENASFFTVAMDLPFFNRNQGNIRAARLSMDQSKLLVQKQQDVVMNEVQTAYSKLLNIDKAFHSFDPAFRLQLDQLLQGVTENFRKKNISLLEFTDFYESYKTSILQWNDLQNSRQQAIEELQFAVGKTLFTY